MSRRARWSSSGEAGEWWREVAVNAVVVYESMFGNTEQVARAVAAGIGEHLATRLTRVGDQVPELSEAVDLVVLGGPTHAFSMSRPETREDAVRQGARPAVAARGIREFLGDSRAQGWHGPVATFDTRVAKVRHLPGSAARRAAALARRQGHQLIADPESFYVSDIHGPLLAGELERARDWGRRLGAAVRDGLRTGGGAA